MVDIHGDKAGGAAMNNVKITVNGNNISPTVGDVTWSGSASQAARSLVFTVAYSPDDKNYKMPQIKNGDEVKFYADSRLLFVGMVTNRERKSEAGFLSYTAQDRLIHLLRSSGTYRLTNTTPEKIAALICKDVQVPVGTLEKTKVTIDKIFFKDRPYYEIIMAGYTKAYRKNGKKYIARMSGGKLTVTEKGKVVEDFYLKEGRRMVTSSYTETLDNMVNRVYIYDKDNKKIGSISNPGWVEKYGVFQGTVTVDSGNGKTEAKNLLHGIDKTASMECEGNVSCISGDGIVIKDSRTGLNGKYWIENDTHTWRDSYYTMSLELAFKNVMDIQEEDEEQEAVSVSQSSGGTSSDALNDVLNQARSWIGTTENPPGSNHNEITVYYGFDAAWCCMFIWAIFNKSGHGDIFMGGGKTAYCFDVMNWYKARGKWGSTPKVGALIIYGGEGHIGIVESVSGSSYTTIEGNYGNMVQRRNGPGQSQPVLGFCYPDYPVTVSAGTASDSAISGTAVAVPSSVAQTGIIGDYTNYSYFYPRWTNGTMQRKVADTWGNDGKPSANGIATIDGYYLVAVRPVFGECGDLISVVLEGGARINCIIADIKGSDATSTWGHSFGGKISIVEFESIGNSYSNTGAQLNISQWQGKKVTTVINGGRYSRF